MCVYRLSSALLGEGSLRRWHEATDRLAPDAYMDWIKQQGFDEKQALHLKWLSKDMNQHDQYMADFMEVYQALDRWGPGTQEDTLKALALVPITPTRVIDMGCGKGFSTSVLAAHTPARVVALDNEPAALEQLTQRLTGQGLEGRVSTLCVSMTDVPFKSASFDLIWAEGSAYIMGVERALKAWRLLLQPGGCMVISDLVWLTDSPSKAASDFWHQEYPDMQTVATRVHQMQQAGYEVIGHFSLSQQAWRDYYEPLKARLSELRPQMPGSLALREIAREVAIYEQYLGEFGYEMFILRVE